MNQKQEKRLAADGAYGQHVNGYQGDGKARFLRDARAMLKTTARHLAARGLTASDIRVNPRGVAVSGDVSAHYWDPAEAGRRVYANLGAAGLGWGRRDELIVLARVETFVEDARARKRAAAGWRCAGMGPNQWLSANLDALELAEALRALLAPATTPATMMAVTAHWHLPIPHPIVTPDVGAEAWAGGMRAVERAFAEDNALAQEAGALPATLPLFHFHGGPVR